MLLLALLQTMPIAFAFYYFSQKKYGAMWAWLGIGFFITFFSIIAGK